MDKRPKEQDLMRNVGYYILVIVITVLVVMVLNNDNSAKFKNRINELEKEYDRLEVENRRILDSIEYYNTLIIKEQKINDSLFDVLDKLKIKRHEIPSKVDDYSPSKLDSILATYKHPRGN